MLKYRRVTMHNQTPSNSDHSWGKPFPIVGNIDPNDITQRMNLIGNTEGEQNGYPVGLVCVLNLTAMTATPLAGTVTDTNTLGILMDRVDDLANSATSTQQFNLVYRNVTIHKLALTVHSTGDLEKVAKHFEKNQNCGVIN